MNVLGLVTVLCMTAGLFDLRTIPIEHPEDHCFAASLKEAEGAALFVLGKDSLRVFPALPETPFSVPLGENVTAIDIADVDGDGFSEAVAVCGDEIVCHALAGGADHAAKVLFHLTTQFAKAPGMPFLHVMIVRYKDVFCIALPCESALELRTSRGELVEKFPIGPGAPHRAIYGRPFVCAAVSPPQYGGPGALEFRVTRMIAVEPDLPPEFNLSNVIARVMRHGTARQIREASGLPAESWPWFSLRNNGEGRDRVLYAAGSDRGGSVIRVQRESAGNASLSEPRTGPERRYPGQLVLSEEDLPDFNGDGFTDLLFWSAPEPAPTAESVTRAILGVDWPVRLSVHLFVPEKNRFAPQAAGVITLKTPIAWFFNAPDAPLQHVVLQDFDGDRLTDLGFSSAPDTYAVWRFTPKGFGETPEYAHTFNEPLRDVALKAKLDTSGRVSLVLRTDSAFQVVQYRDVPPEPVTAPLLPSNL